MALLPSSRRKGLGALLDGNSRVDTYGLPTMRLTHTGADRARECLDLERHIPRVDGKPRILDQGATSSCVAHAFVAGIHITEHKRGLPYASCSRLYPYYNSRREHLILGTAVWDSGTYLRTCAVALRKFGTPDERFWQWGQSGLRVNKRPSWNAMRHAHARRGGKYVRIYETGEERTRAMRQAIMAGHPVAFGTPVSDDFLSASGSSYVLKPTVQSLAGNHAMLAIGWQTDSRGEVWFRVLNSWGSRWRDGGMCWMSADYMRWHKTTDLHIIYEWERVQ